ncbi:hypothetical protein P3342_006120 [Pyrenophora teres f. teres]|nr:hypothetical protein P3342_006120 [Pyrenophora teres f. teres]
MSSIPLSTHHDKEDRAPVSTLQVNRDAEGLQVDYDGLYPDPMKKHHPDDKYISQHNDAGLMPMEQANPEPLPTKHRRERICGLKRRTFFIVMIVVMLVVTVAAVGGGVGGYQASKIKLQLRLARTKERTPKNQQPQQQPSHLAAQVSPSVHASLHMSLLSQGPKPPHATSRTPTSPQVLPST